MELFLHLTPSLSFTIFLLRERKGVILTKLMIFTTRYSLRISASYTSFMTRHTGLSSRPAAQWRGGNKLRIRGRFASGRANCRRPATAMVLEHPFYRLRLAPLFSSPPFPLSFRQETSRVSTLVTRGRVIHVRVRAPLVGSTECVQRG